MKKQLIIAIFLTACIENTVAGNQPCTGAECYVGGEQSPPIKSDSNPLPAEGSPNTPPLNPQPAPAPATPVAPTPAPVMSSSCGPEDTAAISCASNVLRQRSYYGDTGLCNLECVDNNGRSGWRFEALQVRPDLETQIRFSCLPHIPAAFQACGF